MSYLDKAKKFLEVADQFRLGDLPTEKPHPKTEGLSVLANNDLEKGFEILKEIDLEVLDILSEKLDEVEALSKEIKTTLKNNGRIFLGGCGATGRLSLALETLWRQKTKGSELSERVIGFMAGGDVALIQSIEKFEDYPEYGARQLKELGFKDGDLFIGITEGGETPFVIGATEYAALASSRNPYFLFCNPEKVLIENVERSRRVIENNSIKKMNLHVGPMALTGSTRMQATTIQMYAVGLALWFYEIGKEVMLAELLCLRASIEQLPKSFLREFTEREASIYQDGEFVYYETDDQLGISILTDTTERSPTFSLHPFESQNDSKKLPSLSYLYFPAAKDQASGWNSMLKREPRVLEWDEEIAKKAGKNVLEGFDFSQGLIEKREKYLEGDSHYFKIYINDEALSFELDDLSCSVSILGLSNLSAHILLKTILNSHSTLVMGRLGRYESNIMTWVRSSNNKLIDRSARYILHLLGQEGIEKDYNDVVEKCFEIMQEIGKDQPLVLKTFESIKEST